MMMRNNNKVTTETMISHNQPSSESNTSSLFVSSSSSWLMSDQETPDLLQRKIRRTSSKNGKKSLRLAIFEQATSTMPNFSCTEEEQPTPEPVPMTSKGQSRKQRHIQFESSAMKRAKEIQAKLSDEFPSFIKYMFPTAISRNFWLTIPSYICVHHLPGSKTVMELVDESGNTFHAKYMAHRPTFSSGWRSFSKAHNLEEGDVLVFHLVKRTTFKVYIIRRNALVVTDGASRLSESDTCAGVMMSNDGEKHSNACAKAQQPLESMLSDSPTNLLEDTDLVPSGSGVLKKFSFNKVFTRRRKCSSSTATEDPDFIRLGLCSDDHAPLQSVDMSSDTLQATEMNPVSFKAIDMCTSSFGDHIESLWKSFPADKLVHFTYLECLWFEAYRKASQAQRTKVLVWIKKKIFSRNYVFAPICCWGHWNLLILCHFDESLDSDNKKPFMLLLDSLHLAGPVRLEREIRKFIWDIYKEEGISDQRVSDIPLLVPMVPQQRNKECGFFSLYFIKKFIETVPETISESDVSFINQNWFGLEELDSFCIAVIKESKEGRLVEAMTSKETVHESDSEGDCVVTN